MFPAQVDNGLYIVRIVCFIYEVVPCTYARYHIETEFFVYAMDCRCQYLYRNEN